MIWIALGIVFVFVGIPFIVGWFIHAGSGHLGEVRLNRDDLAERSTLIRIHVVYKNRACQDWYISEEEFFNVNKRTGLRLGDRLIDIVERLKDFSSGQLDRTR